MIGYAKDLQARRDELRSRIQACEDQTTLVTQEANGLSFPLMLELAAMVRHQKELAEVEAQLALCGAKHCAP